MVPYRGSSEVRQQEGAAFSVLTNQPRTDSDPTAALPCVEGLLSILDLISKLKPAAQLTTRSLALLLPGAQPCHGQQRAAAASPLRSCRASALPGKRVVGAVCVLQKGVKRPASSC